MRLREAIWPFTSAPRPGASLGLAILLAAMKCGPRGEAAGCWQLRGDPQECKPQITSPGLRAPSPTEQGGAPTSLQAQHSPQESHRAGTEAHACSREPRLKARGAVRAQRGLAPIMLGRDAGRPPVETPEGPSRTRAPLGHPNSPADQEPADSPPHLPSLHPPSACQTETQSSLKGNKYRTFSNPELPAP